MQTVVYDKTPSKEESSTENKKLNRLLAGITKRTKLKFQTADDIEEKE